MTRPKKGEKANNEAQLMIPVEEFMRTRDNVVTSLTTLQGAIGDLLRAYIAHTTSVLGGGSGTELSAVTANILTSANTGAASAPGVDEKKKKVRRKKDPNAPKAPPTAYFLYAQQARPLIKKDLGEGAKGDAVTMEASKRWNTMGEEEKDTWRNLYKTNFAVYKQQLAAYNAEKAARGEATVEEEDIPEDADAIADAVAGAAPEEEAEAESAASSSSSESDSEEEEEEEEKEPTPPPKPETPKKRGKAAKANGVSEATPVKQTPVPLPTPAVAPAEKTKSPEKRKKGAAAAAEESAEEPKKKKGRKGKVAETVEESVEEPAPEVKEKKRKRKDTKA